MPSATSTDFLAQKQMEYLLMNTPWTPPAALYLALFTTLPSLDGTNPGVEVTTTGTAYTRVAINAVDGWGGPFGDNVEYSNLVDLQYQVPTNDWGTIVGSGLFDAITGGNLYYVSSLTVPKNVLNGDGAPRVLSGQLRISRATCTP